MSTIYFYSFTCLSRHKHEMSCCSAFASFIFFFLPLACDTRAVTLRGIYRGSGYRRHQVKRLLCFLGFRCFSPWQLRETRWTDKRRGARLCHGFARVRSRPSAHFCEHCRAVLTLRSLSLLFRVYKGCVLLYFERILCLDRLPLYRALSLFFAHAHTHAHTHTDYGAYLSFS